MLAKPEVALRLDLRTHLSQKVTVLPEEFHQRIFRLLNIAGGVGHLRVVVRHLQQARVRELFYRAGKFVHANVNRRLKNKYHSHPVRFGFQIKLHILETACA